MLIEFFEVPPDADEAFLAEWRAARAGATLYRAIRDDTPVRFVSVAPGDAYELVHEDGDVVGPGGVIQITTFAGADTGFLPAWRRPHEIERGRRGYLGTRLYRAIDGREWIAIARWSSPLMVFRTAQQREFRDAAVPFASAGALYTIAAGCVSPSPSS